MPQNNVNVNQDPTQILKQLMAARQSMLGPYQKGVNKKLEEAGAAHVEEALQGGVDPRQIQSQAGLDHPVMDQQQEVQPQMQPQQPVQQDKVGLLKSLLGGFAEGFQSGAAPNLANDQATRMKAQQNQQFSDPNVLASLINNANKVAPEGYQADMSVDHGVYLKPKAAGIMAQMNPNELDSISNSLVNGQIVPSQLPRIQKAQAIAAALEKDPNYSPAKADMEFAVNKSGGTSFEKNFNNLDSFHKDFELNSDYLLTLSDDYLRSSTPAINKAIIAGDKTITGNPKATKFLQALNTVANGYARLQNPTLSGQALSDAARKEAQELIPQFATSEQIKALLDPQQGSMRIDAQNRMDAAQSVKDRINSVYDKSDKGESSKKVGKYTYE